MKKKFEDVDLSFLDDLISKENVNSDEKKDSVTDRDTEKSRSQAGVNNGPQNPNFSNQTENLHQGNYMPSDNYHNPQQNAPQQPPQFTPGNYGNPYNQNMYNGHYSHPNNGFYPQPCSCQMNNTGYNDVQNNTNSPSNVETEINELAKSRAIEDKELVIRLVMDHWKPEQTKGNDDAAKIKAFQDKEKVIKALMNDWKI